jgi:hypothetical protein
MNTIEEKDHAPADLLSQELFKMELRIARRADELVRTLAPFPGRDVDCWLEAEREVLAG